MSRIRDDPFASTSRKNGQDMITEPHVVIYAEELTVPCLRGSEASEDLRRSLLYFIEENYPNKASLLESRISMQSKIWSLPDSQDRYEKQKNDYSEHATLSLKLIGYEVIIASNFAYLPGTYFDRSDRRSEHERMFKTYIQKDTEVEY